MADVPEDELLELFRRQASGAASIGFAAGIVWSLHHLETLNGHRARLEDELPTDDRWEDWEEAFQAGLVEICGRFRDHFERRHAMYAQMEGVPFEVDDEFLAELDWSD